MSTPTCMCCGQEITGPYANAPINRCRPCAVRDGDFSIDTWNRILSSPDRSGAYAREVDQRRRPTAPPSPGEGFPPLTTPTRPPGLKGDEWFIQTLDRNFLPSNERSLRQWSTLAKRHGKALDWAEAVACVEWCLEAARMKGTQLKYAEHAIAFAERWALIRTHGSSTDLSKRMRALHCHVTPRIGSPTIADSNSSTPPPTSSTDALALPNF